MGHTDSELGRRLRTLRNQAGLTQQAVAEGLGVTRPVISKIESGKKVLSVTEFTRLCAMYGANPLTVLDSQASTPQRALFRGSAASSAATSAVRFLERVAQEAAGQRKVRTGQAR